MWKDFIKKCKEIFDKDEEVEPFIDTVYVDETKHIYDILVEGVGDLSNPRDKAVFDIVNQIFYELEKVKVFEPDVLGDKVVSIGDVKVVDSLKKASNNGMHEIHDLLGDGNVNTSDVYAIPVTFDFLKHKRLIIFKDKVCVREESLMGVAVGIAKKLGITVERDW